MAWSHAVRLPWSRIRRPRLSTSKIGCYNARIVLSNIGCGISKQWFPQQLAWLHNADNYAENIWRSMTFNFENLFVALGGLHRARIGHRNGIKFYMTEVCAWTTGPCQWNFFLVSELHDSILEFRFLHC